MVNALINDYWGEDLEGERIGKTDGEVGIGEEKSTEILIDGVVSAVNDNCSRIDESLFFPDYVHPRDYDGLRRKKT